jgi:C-terminal processing protease CtpA/Prc
MASGAGRVILYLQVNRSGSEHTSQTGQAAGAAWRRDELLADVPKDAETLQFGLVVAGSTEGWIDAVEVQILGDAGLGNEPAHVLTGEGAANLAALARLVALVRYFHPSDESARLDWPLWTIEAVGQVEGARDAAELARILNRLIAPIAPTARVFLKGSPPPPVSPPRTPESRRIAWRHYGLGTGTPRSAGNFASRRAGGFVKPDGEGGALWILDAATLHGKTLALRASTRAEWQDEAPGKGELWVSAVDRDGRALAHDRRPVEEASWQDTEIKLPLPENVAKVYFGVRLTGGGRLFLDRAQVTASGGADTAPREVLADGFEADTPGRYPEGWFVSPDTRAAGYRVEVTEERPREGRRALMIAWGLDVALPDPERPFLADLGRGVSLRLPLALFADTKGTLPHASQDPAFERRKPEGFLPSSEDRATRLADVLLLWAALDRFYSYPLEHWPSSLDRALREAATDKDTHDFLDTLRGLTADLRDNHVTVARTGDPADYRLPLLWRVVDGRLMVTWADPAAFGIHAGDIVEAVDGTPAREALQKLEPLVSAATPAYRRYRALELLGASPKGTSHTLRIRRGGETTTATLQASAPFLGPDRLRGARPERIAELRPGLFYIDLDRIDDGDFEATLPRLREAKGIIFDLRGYPERVSESFLAHLISSPAKTPGTWTAIRTRPDAEPTLDHLAWTVQPLLPHLSARVVFLTDERAYSRAETYLDMVSFYHLGEIVGAPTGGTNGEVDDMDLPGGFHVTWTGSRVVRLGGKELERVGIRPTDPVEPTAAGVAAGRDEVLDRAIGLFR